MSQRSINDSLMLTSELRHLGSSIPWFRVSQAPKKNWFGKIFRFIAEVAIIATVVGVIISVI